MTDLFLHTDDELRENFVRSRLVARGLQSCGTTDLRGKLAHQFKPGVEPEKRFLHDLMCAYLESAFDQELACRLLTDFVSIVDPDEPAHLTDFASRAEELGFDPTVTRHFLEEAADGTVALYGLFSDRARALMVLEEAKTGLVLQVSVDGGRFPVRRCTIVDLVLDEWIEGKGKGPKASGFVGEAANGAIGAFEREHHDFFRKAVAVSDDPDVSHAMTADRVAVIDGDILRVYDDPAPFQARKIKIPGKPHEAKALTDEIEPLIVERMPDLRKRGVEQAVITTADPVSVVGHALGAFFALAPIEEQKAMTEAVEHRSYFVTERRYCPEPLPEGGREIVLTNDAD